MFKNPLRLPSSSFISVITQLTSVITNPWRQYYLLDAWLASPLIEMLGLLH